MEEKINSMENLEQGANGAGVAVVSQPVTTTIAELASPDLLANAIDRRIVKVRPMSTPIDQLSRCAGGRTADSMTVEYASVDIRPAEATLAKAVGGNGQSLAEEAPGVFTVTLAFSDASADVSETFLANGPDGKGYVFYILEKLDSTRSYKAIVLNPNEEKPSMGSTMNYTIPQFASGTKFVRMGRAAAELDVQTAQFATLPARDKNYCQIFKMQVEESTLMKLARKDLSWDMSDQEEAAIIDMRLGMEKSFIFGHKTKIFDPIKQQDVYLTGGIWNQAKSEIGLESGKINKDELIRLCSEAFVGKTGSKQKIFLCGTKLMEELSRIEFDKVVAAGETVVKWGIEFREIRSNFGTLYVIHSEIFDQCGHTGDGMIIDPEFITKYVHIPFTCEKLDLRKSGQRNTDAVVLTEASCLVLRYPETHFRVITV